MAEKPSKTVVRSWARLVRAQALALAGVEKALKLAGLPPLAWYDVLLELERSGDDGMRPFELERALLLAQYNLSRLLDRIEAAGYIKRIACDADGRGQQVVLTSAGRELRTRMWPVYAQAIEASVGRHISSKDAQHLDEILGRLIEKLSDRS